MNKHYICNHLIDSVIYIGQQGNFDVVKTKNKSLFTGINSPVFNYVSFGSCEPHLIESLKAKKLPFICFAQSNIEKDFPKWCYENNFVKDDEVITHKFEKLDTWGYQPNSALRIEKVSNKNELNDFDFISSNAFQHPPQAAFDFFKSVLNDLTISLFVAYHENVPVGCGMVSFVNDIAGLYLGGVLPEYRRQGIGCELTKYRMNYIKQQGFKTIIVQNLSSSISYYQKLGFKPMGSVAFYLYSDIN